VTLRDPVTVNFDLQQDNTTHNEIEKNLTSVGSVVVDGESQCVKHDT